MTLYASGEVLGWAHNHPGPGGEHFSGNDGDKGFSNDRGIPGFVVTPSYRTLRYDVPDSSNFTREDAFKGYQAPQGSVTDLTNTLPANDLSDIVYQLTK